MKRKKDDKIKKLEHKECACGHEIAYKRFIWYIMEKMHVFLEHFYMSISPC
jgi:hypothetical protein